MAEQGTGQRGDESWIPVRAPGNAPMRTCNPRALKEEEGFALTSSVEGAAAGKEGPRGHLEPRAGPGFATLQ